MDGRIFVRKEKGETMGQLLGRIRSEYDGLVNATLSYIGRLDPLAYGEVAILVGEENKNREQHLHTDKVYRIKVAFGFSTDTGDVLGLVTDTMDVGHLDGSTVCLIAEKYNNRIIEQPYPAYSSKTVQGKPLWQWAREGKLAEIDIPTKSIEIKNVQYLGFENLQLAWFTQLVQADIRRVDGDFRQDAISATWDDVFGGVTMKTVPVAEFRVHASSGAYMRSLAEMMGESLGVPALALEIEREEYVD